MRLDLSRFFRRKPVFSRAAVRYACQINCELVLTDSMVVYEGRLIDLSLGGAMFRPRLCYLMHRRDVPVRLQVDGDAFTGLIAATNQDGFGIRFDRPLTEAALARLLGRQVTAEAQAA